MSASITARTLRKEFGDFVAVDGIDFDVAPGESFGFLGPNGAGKTSTMRMIGCVSPITSGTMSIFGLDPATDGPAIRARMGVVPQADQLDSELTVAENLVIYGRYFDIPRAECKRRAAELLDFVQLTERADQRVDPLSGGMKRRLTIARSLMSEPDLLLLDEPTTGLDPQARHILWDRLYRLKQRGVTLVLTTHYMDEAEQLCDRLVVMDGGRIVAEGSPRGLIDQHATREVLELRLHRDELGNDQVGDDDEAAVAAIDGIGDRVEVLPDRILVYAHDGEAALAEVHRRGIEPVGSLVRRSSLEDVFLRLTGRMLITMATPTIVRVWESEFAVYRKTWTSHVVLAFVQPLLYLLGIGLGVGALIDVNADSVSALGGISYFAYLAPALLATTAMISAGQASLWQVLDGFFWGTGTGRWRRRR